MTGQFERYRQPEESPSPEVFAAYVADKRELLQAIGKPIKRAPGNTMTEFFLPPGIDEWSQPDSGGRVTLERSRHYSAAHKKIGNGAYTLLVLECDSVSNPDRTVESTRHMYWFMWTDSNGVFESQAMKYRTLSGPTSEVAMLDGRPSVITLTPSEPLSRTAEHVLVTPELFEGLHQRTAAFGADLVKRLASK